MPETGINEGQTDSDLVGACSVRCVWNLFWKPMKG